MALLISDDGVGRAGQGGGGDVGQRLPDRCRPPRVGIPAVALAVGAASLVAPTAAQAAVVEGPSEAVRAVREKYPEPPREGSLKKLAPGQGLGLIGLAVVCHASMLGGALSWQPYAVVHISMPSA